MVGSIFAQQVRYSKTALISAIVSIVLVAAAVFRIAMNLGEGGFGAAKLLPLLFFVGAPTLFCLMWFPMNVVAYLRYRRTAPPKSLEPFLFSIVLFVLPFGIAWLNWFMMHHPN